MVLMHIPHNVEAYGIFIEEVREEDGTCDLHNIPIPIDIPLYASSSVYLDTKVSISLYPAITNATLCV